MLKNTLGSKKLCDQIEKVAVDEASFRYYNADQVLVNANLTQQQGIHAYENQETLRTIEESSLEGITGPVNPTQMSTISREPSQSESSAAPLIVSNGLDVSDELCISTQAPSVCESSMNQTGIERSPEDFSRTKAERRVNSIWIRDISWLRKDYEQSKQIEELEKQNQELADEKERLLEEIERIIAETGNM
ncbi:hypothetical protein Salat_0719500 [Sesamum alatum]|uniref:Uncharacterized protein n=1 Tax=Sesamum alatum TaxID=300844 RepID=A0AAE2CV24_9LAMI|nr:hypothetical protein Salat_0719500 [Sesamum alatum]